MPFILATRKLCLAVFGAFTAVSAPVMAREALAINVERDAATGDMIVVVSYPTCLSTSARALGNDITVTLDESTASIRADGAFQLAETFHIQTADCMGRLQEEFTFKAAAARRYRIFDNGDFVGVKDFTPAIAEESATCPARFNVKGRNNAPFGRDRYCHWRSLAANASALDLLSLISAIVGSHPENGSNPESTFTLSINPPANVGVSVAMELHGIEDDAVAGKRYRGMAVKEESGWRFTELVTQNLCARGERAGQWSKDECD